jgi:hypothetical protein
MGLDELFARLRAELSTARARAHLELGAKLEPALAGYLDSSSILATLRSRGCGEYAQRNHLVAVLVRMHQRKRTSFWAAMLLVTFAPMLRMLRSHVRGQLNDPGELDQVILDGFLVAISTQPTAVSHLPTRLRQGVRAFVFSRLNAERSLKAWQCTLERTVRAEELFLDRIPKKLNAADRCDAAELLFRIVGQSLPRRKLELVVATRLQEISLKTYIRDGHVPWDAASEPFAMVLARAKRERSRTLRQLRPMVESRLLALASDVERTRSFFGRHA